MIFTCLNVKGLFILLNVSNTNGLSKISINILNSIKLSKENKIHYVDLFSSHGKDM